MSEYAISMLTELLESGPSEGEDFFRMKATGNGQTNWFNVTPEQLALVIKVLADDSMAMLVAEIREALEGDSNDAEHDALASVAEYLNINYRLES